MSLPLPQIPDNATESYLEKVAEKIYQRLDGSGNKRVKERLHTLLATVEERRLRLHQQAKVKREAERKDSEHSPETPLELLKSSELSEDEQQNIKKRLKNVLADIKQQRSAFPQETMTFSPASQAAPAEEDDEPAPSSTILAKLDLNQEDYGLVKERMAEMLNDIKQQRGDEQKEEEEEEILELGPDQALSLGPEQEIDLLVEQTIDLGPEFEVYEGETIQLETEAVREPAEVEGETRSADPLQQAIPSQSLIERTLDEESGELTFSDACRRVAKGEAVTLLEKVGLSEREQEMFAAFTEHLSQMKGLKRQQVFEMQHMTGRSIRELEQIFKTYHLHGYLRAEMNNIYNRLLNLRSRFSVLQH